ncbi:MAG TPA: hypothetical protein VFA72_21970 [Burkholderiales bacterium]|nr:hypothetical protein [Burkholderiales bacterium]
MKSLITALAAVALVAGCAQLPESLKHPFAAAGATSQTDARDAGTVKQVNPYPYNSPYGG